MGSKQQIEKDRERIAELYKIIREKKHNYDLAIEALLVANKYLNKADNQRKELALREEIIRCGDCKHYREYEPDAEYDGWCGLDRVTDVNEDDFCSKAERKEQ